MAETLSLYETLYQSMKDATHLTPADRGVAELVLDLADEYDNATDIKIKLDITAKLTPLVNDLGLTPRGRREPAQKGSEVKNDDTPRGKLLALRGGNNAGARQHGASASHPA